MTIVWLGFGISCVVSYHAGAEHQWNVRSLDGTFAFILFWTSAPAAFNKKVKLVCSFYLRQHESNLPDNLFSWWQYTKYILFSNHAILTSGHLSCRTLSRQRSKQNLFFRMSTWLMMYVTFSGRHPASWLGSTDHWIRSCHLPILPMFAQNTHQVFPFRGSSHASGCWHLRSSCHLHYSFFTDAEPW